VLFSLNLILQILCIATVHIYNISTMRIYNCCKQFEKNPDLKGHSLIQKIVLLNYSFLKEIKKILSSEINRTEL
jgi:hypothetical protein